MSPSSAPNSSFQVALAAELPGGATSQLQEQAGQGKARWRIDELAFRKLFTKSGAAPGDQECAICYQPLHATCVALPCCGHGCHSFFHGVCIRPWLVRNPSCPLCRSDLKSVVTHINSEGLKTADRTPLPEFWLVEIEEEAAPWLRRERHRAEEERVRREHVEEARLARVGRAARAAALEIATEPPSTDVMSQRQPLSGQSSRTHLRSSTFPSSPSSQAYPLSPGSTAPLPGPVVPLGPATASFASLITGAPRPGSLPRPSVLNGGASSRRTSGSRSGSGSRSSSRLSTTVLAEPQERVHHDSNYWRARCRNLQA